MFYITLLTQCMKETCEMMNLLHPFTFGRNNLLKESLANFAFEDSGSFAAAFDSSFGDGFTCLAAGSLLISIFGGSGGGGGGIDIPLAAAGGSDT